MHRNLAYLALATTVTLGAARLYALEDGTDPLKGKTPNATEAEKQIQKRVKIDQRTVNGTSHVVLNFDNHQMLDVPGGKAEVKIEGNGADRAMVVRIDGKEFSRVPLPKADLKEVKLPPLALPNLDRADVRSESSSINGVSNSKVWVNGQLVYDGPGSNSSSVSRNENGRKFVEVTVDGKVVYRVGEDGGEAKRK